MAQVLEVKLSGVVVGRATTWKEAEAVVAAVLKSRGKKVRKWDGGNTSEDGQAFDFRLR